MYSFYVSIHATDYLRIGKYVGLRHYIFLFSDPVFLRDTFISVKYVIGSLIGAMGLGMALALVLNKRFPFSEFFKTICALPWVISQTVTALLWIWLLDPSFGPINFLLEHIGIGAINFIANESTALPVLICVNVWMSYPFAMILLLAGLQTVPMELYEAAKIDGASSIQMFFQITLPVIRNTIVATCIMLTFYYFTMVTLIYTFTGGGPMGSTEVLSLRVFNETFRYWRIGGAAAIGIVILLLNAIFSIFYVRVVGSGHES
jgi:multiple sugar transport system permease protein